MNSKYQYYENHYDFFDRKEYYERMIFPKSISLFTKAWQSKKSTLLIDSPIIFRGLKFGDNPEIISKKLGDPRFVIESHGISSLVFFYKEKINRHRVITQIHFIRDEFFCACYTFRYENHAQRLLVKKTLFEKYANMDSEDIFLNARPGNAIGKYDSLVDETGNIIHMVDNVNFHIIYLWGDEKVRNEVAGVIRSGHFHEATKKQVSMKDLFSKL